MNKITNKNYIICIIFLLSLGYYIFNIERFIFKVTPWKTTCLNNRGNRCPQCCKPGFNGQPTYFKYTGDKERMNDSLTCSCRNPGMKNRETSYSRLDNTYGFFSKENYGNGRYCMENYCTNLKLVEGFCGMCGVGLN